MLHFPGAGLSMNIVTETQELFSSIRIKVGTASIEADLILPAEPIGIVLMAHGTGSSRLSPRNRFVASVLRERGLGTLLLDIETADEARVRLESGIVVIDVAGMAQRILQAAEWFRERFASLNLAMGFIGSGTGGAAVLAAAAEVPERVQAVVSRGGRVELVSDLFHRVAAPTLLIVGAKDSVVVENNWKAVDLIASPKKQLEIIPGAQHLFTEPGALAAVAMHAAGWFSRYLVPSGVEMADDTRLWRASAPAVMNL